MVGWRQRRALSQTGEAWPAHDGLAGRGHPRLHRKRRLTHEMAASPSKLSRRQNPRSYSVSMKLAQAARRRKGHSAPLARSGLPRLSDRKGHFSILGERFAQTSRRPADHEAACKLGRNLFASPAARPKRPAATWRTAYRGIFDQRQPLGALCCSCTGVIYKRVSLAKLSQLGAIFEVTIMQAHERIGRDDHALHK